MRATGPSTACDWRKGYRVWAADIGPDFNPLEAGLGFAVAFDKATPFIGQDAVRRQREQPLTRRLVTFTIADDPEVQLWGRETIIRNGERMGWLASGGFGPYSRPEHWHGLRAEPGGRQRRLLGQRHLLA